MHKRRASLRRRPPLIAPTMQSQCPTSSPAHPYAPPIPRFPKRSYSTLRILWGFNGGLNAVGWPALSNVFMAWFPKPEDNLLPLPSLPHLTHPTIPINPLLGHTIWGGWGRFRVCGSKMEGILFYSKMLTTSVLILYQLCRCLRKTFAQIGSLLGVES